MERTSINEIENQIEKIAENQVESREEFEYHILNLKNK